MAKISISGVWDKVPEGSSLIFGDTRFLQHSIGQVEGSSHAKNQLDASVTIDCDRQTDTGP